MADFMTQHACQLSLVVRGLNETAIDVKESARKGEGVNRFVVYCLELIRIPYALGFLRQASQDKASAWSIAVAE